MISEMSVKISTLDIAGIGAALKALRLPHKSVGDSVFFPLVIGVKDLELMSKLVKAGDEHAKVVRGIIVYAEITAPRYWWVEMDTYRIGTERLCSESTMHCEAKGLTGEELQRVKGELKESHEQTRIQYFSYQTLRRIFIQREHHRLPEWHEFIGWMTSLPLSDKLIFVK